MEGVKEKFNTSVETEGGLLSREEMMELAERRAGEKFVEFMEERGRIANIFEHGVERERDF